MKITLCGSTRFKDAFLEWNEKLTAAGHIVYTVAFFGHADGVTLTKEDKEHLDLIHLAKIEESDAIFVLDVDDYIGESTQREIEWARLREKSVWYLSQHGTMRLFGGKDA